VERTGRQPSVLSGAVRAGPPFTKTLERMDFPASGAEVLSTPLMSSSGKDMRNLDMSI